MKKLLILGLAFIVAVPVLAQEPQPRPGFFQPIQINDDARRALFEANREERRDMIEENKEERQELFGEQREEHRALFASSTPEERRELLREFQEERQALFDENRIERRELFKMQWEERKELFASTTERIRANITEEMKERVTDRAEHFADLFSAMLERLSGIADRIETRITELEADGVDVTAAKAALEEADEAIADAATLADSLAAAVADALASDTPRESLAALVDEKEAVKAALRDAHEKLRAAAAALPKPEEGVE